VRGRSDTLSLGALSGFDNVLKIGSISVVHPIRANLSLARTSSPQRNSNKQCSPSSTRCCTLPALFLDVENKRNAQAASAEFIIIRPPTRRTPVVRTEGSSYSGTCSIVPCPTTNVLSPCLVFLPLLLFSHLFFCFALPTCSHLHIHLAFYGAPATNPPSPVPSYEPRRFYRSELLVSVWRLNLGLVFAYLSSDIVPPE
jgi:hypothetical protein